MSSSNPKPRWKVTLDGRDLTSTLAPRLISLTISACRQYSADQLDIALSDHDGQLALPPKTATLQVWLGWDDTGLTDMGTFAIDELEHTGAPDQLILRGRSAHLRGNLREQREQSYIDTTLGAIINQLAGRNGLTSRCHPSLADAVVDHIEQTNESDINFLTRLGKHYDAVATIKAGVLIFCPIGEGTTATGKPLPSVTLVRADGDQHRYHAADRDAYGGIRALYDDVNTGKTEAVLVGTDDSQGVKTLRTIYASKSNALRAARSEYCRLLRGIVTFNYTLARGRPDISPEMHAHVRGFKPDINATDWIVVRAEHSLDGQGFVTRLELEHRTDDVLPEQH
ncbi:phage late control D family protein [Dyella sp.]|uniref:phage late control D family protein n=1 Tax=Dyella sp. TaxID=1869338 RepID=UPI002B4652DA|nr:phage late control D family protein [Dyella sp.]HKT28769.1 phage late control D family protein [Dyella sp.]